MITEKSLDLLCITETWLRDDGSDGPIIADLLPSDYDMFHAPGKNGYGGVGIVFNKQIKLRKVSGTTLYGSFEYLVLRLPYAYSKSATLVIIYRSPSLSIRTFLDEFDDFLNHMLLLNHHELIVVGDFNIHVNKSSDQFVKRFIDIFECHGCIQYITESTHQHGNILDLVLSNTDLVSEVSVHDIAISDHYFIQLNIRSISYVSQSQNTKKTFRVYKNLDVAAFQSSVVESVQEPSSGWSLTTALNQYYDSLRQSLDKHAPLKSKHICTRKPVPWITSEVKEERKLRRKVEVKWRKNKSEENRLKYITQRSKVSDKIKQEKRQYISNQIASSDNKSHTLFKVLRSLTSNSCSRALPSGDNDEALANSFQDFFVNKVNLIRDSIRNDAVVRIAALEAPSIPATGEQMSQFNTVSPEEVQKLLMSAPETTCCLDPVPTWLLKQILPSILNMVSFIINKSLTIGEMPESLKTAVVHPLLKKSMLDPQELSNYRPVSNLSFLSKVLERVVLKQLQEHMDNCGYYDPFQSAYKKCHSTETALVRVNDDLLKALDNGDSALLLLLDLSAAFDTIDFNILRNRLVEVNVTGTVLNWFISYISQRKQSISINGQSSAVSTIECGVPQGSVLGPVLFSIYMLPLGRLIKQHGVSYHAYADDTQLYISFGKNNTETTVKRVEKCVSCIADWMSSNFLRLNAKKTELLYLSSKFKRRTPDIDHIQLGDQKITPAIEVRNLGVKINNTLTVESHVNDLCKSLLLTLRLIAKVRFYLNSNDAKTVVCALFTSRLDYGNSLLIGAPKYQLNRLQMLQNWAARIVSGECKFSHITPTLQSLHWLPVADRVTFKVCTLVFRVISGTAPDYLKDLITVYNPQSRLRSSQQGTLLVKPAVKTKSYGERRFSIAGPALWNELPMNIRTSRTVNEFKSALKTFLFIKRYNTRS